MTTKIISASLRDNSSGKKTFYINIRRDLTAELKLKDTPHVEVTRQSDRYKIKFLTKQTPRSRKISFKDSYSYVGFSPELFKLNHTEPVSSFQINADISEEGTLEFDFDTEEFLRPRATFTNTQKITSAEDKVAAGFKVDTAWGEKYQMAADERIEQEIIASMKRKYSLTTDEIIVSSTSETPSIVSNPTDYARAWVGYVSIATKGAK
jgi:hypothetical protein